MEEIRIKARRLKLVFLKLGCMVYSRVVNNIKMTFAFQCNNETKRVLKAK